MKKSLFLFCTALNLFIVSLAQTEDIKSFQTTARSFMKVGDFDNAIIVLTRALQQDKNNLELQKDLISSYYYKRDYHKALDGVRAIIDQHNADVICYQIAGNVYKALEQIKDCEKVYKTGLKKFPKSGPLYSEYGELLWAKKDYAAIGLWEKGIQEDPGYAGNYYNAALYYYYTKDKVWSLVYGEIFVNMESLTKRAAAMKQLLLDSYKQKLFTEADMLKNLYLEKSEFSKAFLQCMNKQNQLSSRGITTEILTMIRTRFILDWFDKYASKFPFHLFDYHRQLLQQGMFEAYNQWLFGTVETLAGYEHWNKTHADQFAKLTSFQRSRVFKMPTGQYYQAK